MTFLARGMFHFAYGGATLGVFLGWSILSTTLAFTVGGALILAKWTQQNRENSDLAVSLLWAAGIAFGVLMADLNPLSGGLGELSFWKHSSNSQMRFVLDGMH